MTDVRRYGVLVPHFGSHASRERIVASGRLAEEIGFDSVWVRDHVVYRPYGFEEPDATHLDPFVVLSAIAATTERVTLATGALIPHRHPIHLANVIASLDRLAGPGRLLLGMGLGAWQHEFDALGLGGLDRKDLFAEQIGILRALWSGAPVTHDGATYHFREVSVHPTPAGHIPIWACGATLSAAHRAAELCDGWLPRMPTRDLRARVRKLRAFAAEANRPTPDVGVLPFVVPARSDAEALGFLSDRFLAPMYAEADRRWARPAGGAFTTPDDLDGLLLYGRPERIVASVERLHDAGASHVVFDLRLRFADFEDVVRLVGERILPELRRGAVAAGGAR